MDPIASHLVSRFVQIMQLRPDKDPKRIIVVRSQGDELPDDINVDLRYLPPSDNYPQTPTSFPKPFNENLPQTVSESDFELDFFIARTIQNEIELALDLMRLSHAVLQHAQPTGLLLLHGALIEYAGQGFVLAGPGGVGKSTASSRVPAPWRSHSDDVTILVRDASGTYWAHPWPTWSDFLSGGAGGSWDVQAALPLKTIFFIHQAKQDQAQATGEAEALCLSLEVVEQASRIKNRELSVQERRDSNLMRYDNIAALTKSVPCFKLGISKTGAFWHQIERVCHLETS